MHMSIARKITVAIAVSMLGIVGLVLLTNQKSPDPELTSAGDIEASVLCGLRPEHVDSPNDAWRFEGAIRSTQTLHVQMRCWNIGDTQSQPTSLQVQVCRDGVVLMTLSDVIPALAPGRSANVEPFGLSGDNDLSGAKLYVASPNGSLCGA